MTVSQPLFTKPAVIGAGTMGMGIAEVFAVNGLPVLVYEISAEIFERNKEKLAQRLEKRVQKGRISEETKEGILERIQFAPTIRDLRDVDIVIEAIVEKIDIKKEMFQQLEEHLHQDAILASNTSSLSITTLAASTQKPERVLGIHFFNPAPLMPLVEVILGAETDPELADRAYRFLKELGKEPVKVKDAPGFIVNRVARPFHTEPYRFLSQNTDKAQVDRILRSAGFKMGPFELQDLIGIDINYSASVSVYESYFHDPRFRPHLEQHMMVERGALGRKTGKGHYRYES